MRVTGAECTLPLCGLRVKAPRCADGADLGSPTKIGLSCPILISLCHIVPCIDKRGLSFDSRDYDCRRFEAMGYRQDSRSFRYLRSQVQIGWLGPFQYLATGSFQHRMAGFENAMIKSACFKTLV